jgi:ADP-ribosylglycohydrolase
MIININDYRNKVLGCWMGKNIGGTLGFPMEWYRGINDATFYTIELKGDPMPNDDLDIQLLWLIALERHGVHLDAFVLSDYWLSYLTPHWVEYGNSKTYMRAGLVPPHNSIPNNPHKNSCGAFIRSEIWACITPGAPDRAVRYAYEDSILDHGSGEGVYAEMFCAAIESAAFVESDRDKLIEIGLSYIPVDCGVAKAVRLTIECHANGMTWLECRDEILRRHRGHYWSFFGISDRDLELGLHDGEEGYDAPANVAFIILGWLYGEGDFGKSLCITVNCGEDTDCTAATLGSILGIIGGFDSIPNEWIKPIGKNIKTLTLDVGDLMGAISGNIDDLSKRTERIAKIALLTFRPDIELSETKDTCITDEDKKSLMSNDAGKAITSNPNGPIYKFNECDFELDYSPFIRTGESTKLTLKIKTNGKAKHQTILNIKWYNDNEVFTISPSMFQSVFVGDPKPLEYKITAEGAVPAVSRFVIEVTVSGRHTVMLIPIILLGDHS